MISTPRVLIVEDDAGWMKSFQHHFESSAWVLTCVSTVESACKSIEDYDYLALILDIEMKSGGSGLDVLKLWLKSRKYADRVIVISGVLDNGIRTRLIELGVSKIFDKTYYVDSHTQITALLKNFLEVYLNEIETEEQKDIIRTVLTGSREAYRRLSQRRQDRAVFTLEDEYDVQDFVAALLVPFFPNLTREEPTRRVGIVSSRIDLFIRELETAIEIKVARGTPDLRRIDHQLKEDIESWGLEGICKHLFCFVFDLADCPEADRNALKSLEGFRQFGANSLTVEVIVS